MNRAYGLSTGKKIVTYRRELHQNPELSNHELTTTTHLTRWLQEAGIRILPLGLKTGEQGVDTIVTISQIVNALQNLPSRTFSSVESLVVSLTRIEGGNTWNVLPQTVELEGTVRTHSDTICRQNPRSPATPATCHDQAIY